MNIELPKISKAIEEKDILWCLEENYNSLTVDWFPILSKWLNNSYLVFKDHEKYLILIFLVKKTFDYYSTNFIQLSWDQFFALKKIELGKYSIINVAKELNISKETTRRKIEELEKENIIKKTKNGITVQPEFYSSKFIKDHEIFRKSICVVISNFSKILVEEEIIKEKIKRESVERVIHQNFSYAWKVFFELMLPLLVDFKTIFKDLESCHVWMICTLNQNYEVQRYLKLNNLNIKNRKDFFEIHTKLLNKVGINAMSISNISEIPRATVIRKLNAMLKKKFLYVDKKKLYYPNVQTNHEFFYKMTNVNVQRLSAFITKLLNLSIASR